jgi:uncharacterized protein with HEPN domain
MKRDEKVYLLHALEAAEKAVEYTSNKDRQAIHEDEMLVLALVRLLEIIGEAANYVSAEFQSKHPEIPWNHMIGMRKRLIHGYFDINYVIVWNKITEDLPSLIDKLREVVGKEER